jgi:hypothetical protein
MTRLLHLGLGFAVASLASCTALLGLSDKTFGTGGMGGGASSASTSHATTSSGGSSSSSAASSSSSSSASSSSSSGCFISDGGTPSVAWVNSFAPTANSAALIGATELDPSGNVVAVGWIAGASTLGMCGGASAVSVTDGFVASLAPSGTCTLATFPGTDAGSSIRFHAVAPDVGSVTVAGSFAGHFGVAMAQGQRDALVARIVGTNLQALVSYGYSGSD